MTKTRDQTSFGEFPQLYAPSFPGLAGKLDFYITRKMSSKCKITQSNRNERK